MGDEERVRIRRLTDGRKWCGRSARYEIEFREVEDAVERVVTMTPGAELRRLTGMRHPAELATFTNAADLAWDGGTGPWRGWPGVDVEQDPAPSGPPGKADPQDVRRQAQEYVDRRVGGALLSALQVLASTLESVGVPAVADEVSSIADQLLTATSDEEREQVRRRLEALWVRAEVRDLRPQSGSLTEQTICRILLELVPRLW